MKQGSTTTFLFLLGCGLLAETIGSKACAQYPSYQPLHPSQPHYLDALPPLWETGSAPRQTSSPVIAPYSPPGNQGFTQQGTPSYPLIAPRTPPQHLSYPQSGTESFPQIAPRTSPQHWSYPQHGMESFPQIAPQGILEPVRVSANDQMIPSQVGMAMAQTPASLAGMIEPVSPTLQPSLEAYRPVLWEQADLPENGFPQEVSAGTPTLEREPEGLGLDQLSQKPVAPITPQEYPWIVPYEFRGTYTQMANNDVGFSDFIGQATLIFPSVRPLSFTPRVGLTFIDSPAALGIPSTLYSFSGQLMWWQQPSVESQWGYQLALEPGVYSDLDAGQDAFRMQGRAVAIYATSPETQWLFGLAYINREDLPVLPVLGMIYKSDEDSSLELIFPRPRYKHRISSEPGSETWMWVGGEFGGGTWAVNRPVIGDDLLTYSDWRLLIGLERKVREKLAIQGELGFVFNRTLEFDSGIGDFDPDSTFIGRLGFTY